MANFGQRYGYQPLNTPFQREQVDGELRTKLWNILSVGIWDAWEPVSEWRTRNEVSGRIEQLMRRLWVRFFNTDLDTLPDFRDGHGRAGGGAYDVLKKFFMTCEWFLVYNFLEELAQDKAGLFSKDARAWVNQELELHNAAYRFVGDRIAEITSEHDIKAIEDALPPIIFALRAELGMTVNERDYLKVWQETSARTYKYAERFLAECEKVIRNARAADTV